MIAYDGKAEMITLEAGLGGLHGESRGGWGGGLCGVSICDRRLTCYYGCLEEGGYVIDKREALSEAPQLAVAAPLHNPKVAERVPFRAPQGSIILDALAEQGAEGLGPLARLAKRPECASMFDDVPTGEYVAWWRANGARVGRRVGDRIAWEDGASEAIRPESERWMVNGEIVDGEIVDR